MNITDDESPNGARNAAFTPPGDGAGTGRAGRPRKALLSSVPATVFLILKLIDYRSKLSAGLLPSTNLLLACWFVLTGVHALHVAGGVAANVWLVAGSRPTHGGGATAPPLHPQSNPHGEQLPAGQGLFARVLDGSERFGCRFGRCSTGCSARWSRIRADSSEGAELAAPCAGGHGEPDEHAQSVSFHASMMMCAA